MSTNDESLVIASEGSESVPPQLVRRWLDLDERIREHLASYLSHSHAHRAVKVHPDGGAPSHFLDDLVLGGPALRVAFPRLNRMLVRIQGGKSRTRVRFSCTGIHEGLFYGLVRPTVRHVQFVETHSFGASESSKYEDHVRIDFASIIRQLASASATTRVPG